MAAAQTWEKNRIIIEKNNTNPTILIQWLSSDHMQSICDCVRTSQPLSATAIAALQPYMAAPSSSPGAVATAPASAPSEVTAVLHALGAVCCVLRAVCCVLRAVCCMRCAACCMRCADSPNPVHQAESTLMAMGYTREQAHFALDACGGDVNNAVNILLNQ